MLTAQTAAPWLPEPGTAAVCAVSGGLDSMCLLHMLWQWCGGRGIPLTAAHFHHGLRLSADRDESFVRRWCEVRGIPFTAGRGDVRAYAAQQGQSIEEAARELRYAFLRQTAAELAQNLSEQNRMNTAARNRTEPAAGPPRGEPAVLIYTAHHAGDDAETVLLNLIRGTGLRGLAGMPRRRDGIVRPFLDVSRGELQEYAAAHGLEHVEDETNADPSAAARNRVRLELLPLLRELNPQAEAHIREAARQVREAEEFLDGEARRRLDAVVKGTPLSDGKAVRRIVLSGGSVRDAPSCLRPRMVLLALDRLGVGRKDFGAVHLNAVLSLLEGGERNSGTSRRVRRLNLPHGVTALYDGDGLTLENRPPAPETADLLPGVPVLWGAYRLTLLDGAAGAYRLTLLDEAAGAALPDAGVVPAALPDCDRQGGCLAIRQGPEKLTVSAVRPGDRLQLAGSNGSRTVKRLCIDRRIGLTERDGLPGIYADGHLAAVWPLGTDAAFLPAAGDCGPVQQQARRILVEKLSRRD